ncbi:hypothetical protein N1030_03705 [Desulfovibrio mangrovi]|uniref:hypothetical protein n=1 Tax=Desulfovibrio mangrovi TaxID=2976983 RepID=UPI002246A56C|nr:hypothetical protein [Desulfovibrio mangrovi]UZP68093.1 hypothetical protein N1030_03705 [Desulfovibrio mangrovi]
MKNDFALSDVRYVRKITVGSTNPNVQTSEQEKEQQLVVLNEFLNGYPKGRIIGKDVNFGVFAVGEHQVVMQSTMYHIGFMRPLIDEPASEVFDGDQA